MRSRAKTHHTVRRTRRILLLQTLLTAVCLVVIIVAAQDPYWQYFAMNLALLAVLVMSMDLVIGWGGIFALHSTTLFIVGEYVAPVAQIHFGIGFVLALVIAAALSTALSMLFALFALRVRGILLSLVTIFVAVILPSAILSAGQWTGGGDGLLVPEPTVMGRAVTGQMLLVISSGLLVITFVVYRFFLIQGWGARLRLLAQSETTVATLGMRPAVTKLWLFAITAPLVGVAGALYSYYLTYVGITDFIGTTVFTYMALMIGGVTSILGPYIGVSIVFGVPSFMNAIGPYRIGIFGVMLLVVATIAPGGLAGAINDAWARLLTLTRRRQLAVAKKPPASVSAPGSRAEKHLPPRPDPTPTKTLRVVELEKRFGSITALDDCSLTLESGRILGVVGPNGSGKSTLINVISGVYRPEQGKVRLDNSDLVGLKIWQIARAGVRRTFQVPVMPDLVRGWETVALALPSGMRRELAETRARQELEYLGAGNLADLRLEEIPLGYRRLLSIAQVLVADPAFVLLDEPLSGVTAEEADQIRIALRRIADRGVAILVVEHQLDWTLSLADEVAVMQSGAIVDVGPPSAVRATVDRVVRGVTNEFRDVVVEPSGLVAREGSAVPALAVANVTVNYGGAPVVANAELSVADGESVAIVGPNGAGKSSLLKALAGVVPTTSGSIRVFGEEVSKRPSYSRARKGLILAGEGKPLFRSMSVRENLEIGAQLGRRRGEAPYDLVLTAFPDLRPMLERPAASLSGGQQQMVVLAQALLSAPAILLLDEPTLGLAESVARGVLAGLNTALQQQQLALVICGEWDSVVAGRGDTVYEMNNGVLTPRSVQSHSVQSGGADHSMSSSLDVP